jgi:hypothetical protein
MLIRAEKSTAPCGRTMIFAAVNLRRIPNLLPHQAADHKML